MKSAIADSPALGERGWGRGRALLLRCAWLVPETLCPLPRPSPARGRGESPATCFLLLMPPASRVEADVIVVGGGGAALAAASAARTAGAEVILLEKNPQLGYQTVADIRAGEVPESAVYAHAQETLPQQYFPTEFVNMIRSKSKEAIGKLIKVADQTPISKLEERQRSEEHTSELQSH